MRSLKTAVALAFVLTTSFYFLPAVQARQQVTQVTYRGKVIVLNDKTFYLDAKLSGKSDFCFKTLQEMAGAITDATEASPTIVYVAPGVYWTDDPDGANTDNRLVGLSLPQANLTMIGLSDNPDLTIIAGNRGQQAGARGNWNTIGIGDGFHGYNITFGNYCNVDLVYGPDPSRNRQKRQKTITQAQVITRAGNGKLDKWMFENCKFISYLNLFARTNDPHRAFYDRCFFQCTDDAIGTGDVSVYRNCTFDYYSNHPSAIGSNIVQVYLGCRFNAVLRDPGANSTIFYAKRSAAFPTIDGVFTGNLSRLEWTDNPNDERQYVYNNTLHGRPVVISSSRPELSVNLVKETLSPFKVGEEYNVYNLLREDDDWDPAGQKKLMAGNADLAYRLQLRAAVARLKTNESTVISPIIYPARIKTGTPLKWSVSEPSRLVLAVAADGTARVTATAGNLPARAQQVLVKAETSRGIVGVIAIDLVPDATPAPALASAPRVSAVTNGKLTVNYMIAGPGGTDQSQITWYRASRPDAGDSIQVAVTRQDEPLKTYELNSGDIGYYLVASVSPKYASSLAGAPVIAVSRKISVADVPVKSIHTTFRNSPVKRSTAIRNGWWTMDSFRPADLPAEFTWQPATGNAWDWGRGEDGTADRYGLITMGRGARLLYARAGVFGDMSVTVKLSPHKRSGQGFGSATGQFADIYIKFDPATLTGYGLRIQRTPSYGEGVKFVLYKFVNGKGEPIGKEVYSSAFMPGCTVRLTVSGNKLTAIATTTSLQSQVQKESGLSHEVNLTALIEPNSFGGTGLQHTGTVSAGNRLMIEGFDIDY